MALKYPKKVSSKKEVKPKDGAQYITIRLSNDNVGLKEKIEKIADREGLTFNELVNELLAKFWEANK